MNTAEPIKEITINTGIDAQGIRAYMDDILQEKVEYNALPKVTKKTICGQYKHGLYQSIWTAYRTLVEVNSPIAIPFIKANKPYLKYLHEFDREELPVKYIKYGSLTSQIKFSPIPIEIWLCKFNDSVEDIEYKSNGRDMQDAFIQALIDAYSIIEISLKNNAAEQIDIDAALALLN